jgi:hypothetical protein
VQNLAFFVFSDLIDDGIQPVAYPTDSQILLRNVASPIEPIRSGEQFPRLLEPNAAPGIRSETRALSKIEAKAHLI